MQWPLSRKILCLALLNLLLLAVVLLSFARSQFRLGPESLILGPARDRILAIANAFNLDFGSTEVEGRDALLAGYRRRYRADFFLLRPTGEAIAGPEVELPREVLERTRQTVPPPPPRRADPPPDGAGPPEGDPDPRPPRRDPPPRRDWTPDSVFLLVTRNPTSYWAGARISVPDPEGHPPHPGLLLLRTSSLLGGDLFFDWRLWFGMALAVAAVSVLCWLPFIRGLTRSIAQMDRATQQIAEGQFDVHVVSRRRDELGHLGEQINRMSARLESFVKNQKHILGDIAHELCAPLARIQFALGILEERAGDAHRGDVGVLHEEIQEMSGLVNELLSFSKAGMSSNGVPLAAVGVAALAERAVAREAFADATVECAIDRDLAVMAHEAFLLRALSNILRNAIRYAGQSGPITIQAGREEAQVAIRVADCGPGLPDSELEEVFAPFYRLEQARTRETGGVGLGLAIVRTCVEACRGTVECRNRKPKGLEVTIRLAAATQVQTS